MIEAAEWGQRRLERITAAEARRAEQRRGQLTEEHTFQPKARTELEPAVQGAGAEALPAPRAALSPSAHRRRTRHLRRRRKWRFRRRGRRSRRPDPAWLPWLWQLWARRACRLRQAANPALSAWMR
ncbi:unnamed protein product [Effrenium voratum]|nr:unnamed protein product [Effrenium voratum]